VTSVDFLVSAPLASVRTPRSPVPPQNPVDHTIVDVCAFGVKLADPGASLAVRAARERQIEPEAAAPAPLRPSPRDSSWPLCSKRHLTAQHIPQLRDGTVPGLSEAGLDASSLREWAALIAIEKARETPSSLMVVTPAMRTWNQFSSFIEEWEGLRRSAA
jgi:hypothetical protein